MRKTEMENTGKTFGEKVEVSTLKKGRITFLLSLPFLIGIFIYLATQASAAAFPDVSRTDSHWEAVEYVSDAGIMVGDENGKFNPGKTVSRAEMATIICRVLEEPNPAGSGGILFTDVSTNHWARDYIKKAVELGIVNGYGDGSFGPSDMVTCEQAVTMIIRTLGGESLAVNAGGYPNGYLTVADDHGFLEGIEASGGNMLTRKEIAVILMNCDNFYFTGDSDNAQEE